MPEVVLDASALLAVLNGEPGADIVVKALSEASISTVNLSEVIAKLSITGMPPKVIREAIGELPLKVTPFDREQAFDAGLLYVQTQRAGLSLGDRACLNLAKTLGIPALTADRSWKQLSIDTEVRVIR